MSNIVRVNYDELQFISKKLHGEADDNASMYSSTVAKVNALRSEWVGDAATQFFNEMDGELLPAVRRLTNALVIMNDVLKLITRIIREADEETAGYFGNISGGDDFGAGKFESALGAALAGAGLGGIAGAGLGSGGGLPGEPGAAGGEAGAGQPGSGTGPGSSTPIDLPTPIPTTQDSATAAAEAQKNAAAASSGAGGGGGGGGGSSGGLQGDLKSMGAGMDAAPAHEALVGGSQGGVENLPEHDFGGSGGGGGSGGSGSGGSTGGGAAGSGGAAGAEGGSTSGGSAVQAGVAGVVGSAAIGAAAKVIKDKQDE